MTHLATILMAILLAFGPPADAPSPAEKHAEIQEHYANKSAEALKEIAETSESREIRMHARYRLYPLTEDEAHIEDLPDELPDATARELALLSGMWGYRASEASVFRAVQYGRRAQAFLDRAIEKDADDPLVMLVHGQTLFFSPAVAGGDKQEALEMFERLSEKVRQDGGPVTLLEARTWVWFAKSELGHSEADDLRRNLLAESPPPLYREFLKEAS